MTKKSKKIIFGLLVVVVLIVSFLVFKSPTAKQVPTQPDQPKAALTVSTVKAEALEWPKKVTANGSVAAWQEAIVGTEANGLRLQEVLVNVGDDVKRGQVLAVFAADTILADLAQAKAGLAQAEANLFQAAADAKRAIDLKPTGALSVQQVTKYLTDERTAKAQVQSQQAAVQVQQLRLKQTRVLAPDAGVISSRSATVGAVLPAGQELFRLIRQGRLEWRAEVPSSDLLKLKAGLPAQVYASSGGNPIQGKLRILAPTVDKDTRNSLAYVDLTKSPAVKAGMFAHGEFDVGSAQALTIPQSAVVLRDGFNYVYKVDAKSKVTQVKVQVGRRVEERVEVLSGLEPDEAVVAAGAGFLSDGDTVKVVEAKVPTLMPVGLQ